MSIPAIKECIMGQVTFSHYRSGELWYTCENGFMFPVPVDDTGTAQFMNVDKGMFFMRYIRKYIDVLTKAEEGQSNEA